MLSIVKNTLAMLLIADSTMGVKMEAATQGPDFSLAQAGPGGMGLAQENGFSLAQTASNGDYAQIAEGMGAGLAQANARN